MKTDTTHNAYHLELHFKRPIHSDMTHITEAKEANIFIREIIDTGLLNHKEFFWMIPLTNANRILGIKEISSGKTHSTTISFKEIAQTALLSNARACLLIHNHPSGNINPSKNDIEVTKRVQKTLNLIDVEILDHLIITQEGYYSFVDNDHIIHPKS
jgi:DNA repair protein RadC